MARTVPCSHLRGAELLLEHDVATWGGTEEMSGKNVGEDIFASTPLSSRKQTHGGGTIRRPTAWTEGHANGVGELVDATLNLRARVLVIGDVLALRLGHGAAAASRSTGSSIARGRAASGDVRLRREMLIRQNTGDNEDGGRSAGRTLADSCGARVAIASIPRE